MFSRKSKYLFLTLLCFVSFAYCQLTEEELDIFRENGVTITEETIDGVDYYKMEHHGIPNHDVGDFPNPDNPNEILPQEHEYYIPVVPEPYDLEVDGNYGCLPMGSIGSTINGIPFYNPYTIEGYNAVEGENREIFDQCDGHPDPTGTYHYHQIPDCVHRNVSMELLGVALDGYAIFGHFDENGDQVEEEDLDVCHGKMYNGRYIYHSTRQFPYLLECYHGRRKDGGNTIPNPPSRQKRQGPPLDWLRCYADCENPAEAETCPPAPRDNGFSLASMSIPSSVVIMTSLLSWLLWV